MALSILFISLGAIAGALCRWALGMSFNFIFPSIPLGTLLANLLGGFLIGIFMFLIKDKGMFSELVRLAIITGFLGSFTTFSTFSAETVSLIFAKQYFLSFLIIILHVGGTFLFTVFGVYTAKFIFL